nr:hypothetical protein [Tanacetum cinerariifolium]
MVNTRTDADLSAAVQNALQTLLPQIRAEIREEFRTSSGPSDAGRNPSPVTIQTWLERFNKQKPHSFEKATAPVPQDYDVSSAMPCFFIHVIYAMYRLYIRSLSVMLSRISFHVLIRQGEGSGTPTEPHHTPSPEATSSHHTTSSIPLPSIPTAPIPTVTQTDTTPIIEYFRRARIAQSSALPTVADEPASPVRDDSQGEACPTDSGFIADQDRATIAKSSTLPRDSAPRVTSPAAEEGSMQQTLNELTAFCTSLQRQYLELLAKFQAQEVEIIRLNERVKILEDKEGVVGDISGDDAPIKGRNEPASLVRDDSQGEACPTDSGFIADQDRATIAKSSTLPYDSAPRVTSPAAEEDSMQQTLNELTALCTSLQRQHSELLAKFQAHEVEINRLKERVKHLEDQEGVIGDKIRDDAPIKGRSTNEGGSIPTAGPPATIVSTGSE